jgi:TonB family protein
MLKQSMEQNSVRRIAAQYLVAGVLSIPVGTVYAMLPYRSGNNILVFCISIAVATSLGFLAPFIVRQSVLKEKVIVQQSIALKAKAAVAVSRSKPAQATPYRGFQLGLLPERRINRRALATSYSLVTLALIILINLSLGLPEKMRLGQYHVTELIPLPSLRPEPAPIKSEVPKAKPKLLPAVELPVIEEGKLVVPRELRREEPKPIEAPKVVVNQFVAPQIKIADGARPELVHTGDFGGSSPKPTVNAPVEKVQTGGFGDPNGLQGQGKQGAKLSVATTGSFDLPAGPGQGDGAGAASGVKGTVASAGFGSGIANGGKGDGRSHGQGVSTGGFGSEQVAKGTGPKMAADTGVPATPIEIIYKPNPIYTDEARDLKLEGEVLLEVIFSANGTIHVNRVVRGLGLGLDEAAIAAANKIRFKPAMRNGQPVDSTAVVHVVFQMAY